MLAAVMMIMAALPACSVGVGSSESIQQNVTVGKRVFVDKSGVVFFACKNVVCSALFKDGEVTEFMPEFSTTGTVYSMAIYNDYIYISAADGFFRYPLSMFSDSGGSGSGETILTQPLEPFSHFEIFEDRIFFLSGSTLCCIPAGGGEPSGIMEGIYDFEVSDRGIYAVKEDGTMIVISPQLNESKEIGRIAQETRMTAGGAALYYNDNGKAMFYSVKKESAYEVGASHTLAKYYTPWSNGKNVLYRDEDYRCWLVTPKGEQPLDKNYEYPSKNIGFIYGDYLLACDGDITKLVVFDLSTGEMKNYDLKTEMKDYFG